MDYLDAAQYIVGSGNLERAKKIADVIKPVKEFAEPICFDELAQLQPPVLPNSKYRFNYSYDELMDIAARCTPFTDNDIDRVFRYAMVFSGISANEDCMQNVMVDSLYSKESRYPRITAQIHNKRLSLRVLPAICEKRHESCKEKFTLFSYHINNGRKYVANGKYVTPITGYYYGASVNVLAYITDACNDNYDITINPRQICSNRCKMCCRTYDICKDTSKLVNFSPEEMVRYLIFKFGLDKVKSFRNISIITGAFSSAETALGYIEQFIRYMKSETDGSFDPIMHSNQSIKISSHLFESTEEMLSLKALGAKRFMYSVEMISENRNEILSNEQINKGNLDCQSIINVLTKAIDIWGVESIEPVYIIGLDDFDRTMYWIDSLCKLGIPHLTRSLFNAYTPEHCKYYAMSFEEIINAVQVINARFRTGYRQNVQTSMQFSDGWKK